MRIGGVPAAPGVVIGPVWRYDPGPSARAVPGGSIAEEGAARAILEPAAADAAAQLEALAAGLRARGAEDEAAILDAQALMAEDPSLIDEAARLAASGIDPAFAARTAALSLAEPIALLDDPLLAARAADVVDVGDRIARIIQGVAIQPPAEPAVAIADDLPPSVAAELPPGMLLGICLEGGTPVAHAAILARGLGIPAVVGATGLLEAIASAMAPATPRDGELTVGLDGRSGEIFVRPDAGELAVLRTRADAERGRRLRSSAIRDRAGATGDGRPVKLLANIGSPRDVPRALAAAAEGVGLLRTEFLFMERPRPPTEDEQVAAYREVFEAFGPDRPVVVRLADIGGDKPLPWLGLPPEPNPFLGVRGIRLADRNPEFLVTQIRAISRAAAVAGVTPRVMAPMVATGADVARFRGLVDRAQGELAAEALPRSATVVTGIMVEIPSAVILAGDLASQVEFFSIGTNDLTQYLFAADRTNAALAHLQDALHPAVLRSIASVVEGARPAGIPVAVCGELAADPAGALVLVGLGVHELSADPNALDDVRSVLAAATSSELRDLAAGALASTDAAAVRALAAPLVARGAGR